jgi:hypothetical protein
MEAARSTETFVSIGVSNPSLKKMNSVFNAVKTANNSHVPRPKRMQGNLAV